MAEGSLLTLLVDVGSVVAVLDLHARIVADINIVTPCLLTGKVVLHTHVHVECLVSFLLAILNTNHLRFLLGSHELQANAVLMALLEQDLG